MAVSTKGWIVVSMGCKGEDEWRKVSKISVLMTGVLLLLLLIGDSEH